MLIRNIKSFQELSNAKKLQSEYLQLMIDNEKVQEERMANYQNPNKPPPVPPQYKTASEIQRDILGQEKTAIENLTSLGIDFPTASTIAQSLQQKADGVANLIKLNRNFPFIKKDITERFNPKLLDAQVILSYLNELFYELDETIGLKLSSQKTEDYFQRDATGIKSVLPSSEMIEGLKQTVEIAVMPINLDKGSIDSLMYNLQILIDNLPSTLEMSKIDTYPTLEKNRVFKEIERLIKKHNIPTIAFLEQRQRLIAQYAGEMDRATTKMIGQMNQGEEEMKGDPSDRQNDESGVGYDELITELSILKNTLGMMNKTSEEKLKEFRRTLDESDYNIKKQSEQLQTAEVPVFEKGALTRMEKIYQGGPLTPEVLEKYINERLRNKKSELDQRILALPALYPGVASLSEQFINEPPRLGNNPVYELLRKPKKKEYVGKDPFLYIDGSLRKLYDNELADIGPLSLYLYYNKLGYNKKTKEYDSTVGNRYNNAEKKDILQDEIAYLKNEYLPANPKYNPIINKADQKIPSMGFGLADKKLAKSFKNHLKVEEYADSSEMETSSEEEKPKKGKGGFKATRIKIGKGVDHDEGPKFKTFGKYIIHMSHLNNDNVLNLKYPSGGGIPSIKPVQVDDNFKEFINDILDTGKMNDRHFKSLTKNEQNHFVKIAQSAKILHKLGLKTPEDGDDQKEVARFELLKGEYDAGNNNEKLIKELRGLVIKFMKGGKINKKSGMDFLMELSIA
jgi:hypothetical protein